MAAPENTLLRMETTGETTEAASIPQNESGLPENAFVCRGGTCTAERFRQGAGVTLDEVGKLHNVSVNSAPGKTLADLTVTIPNQQVEVTTIGAVRTAGGQVLPQHTARKNLHYPNTLCYSWTGVDLPNIT